MFLQMWNWKHEHSIKSDSYSLSWTHQICVLTSFVWNLHSSLTIGDIFSELSRSPSRRRRWVPGKAGNRLPARRTTTSCGSSPTVCRPSRTGRRTPKWARKKSPKLDSFTLDVTLRWKNVSLGFRKSNVSFGLVVSRVHSWLTGPGFHSCFIRSFSWEPFNMKLSRASPPRKKEL